MTHFLPKGSHFLPPTWYFCLRGRIFDGPYELASRLKGHRHQVGANRSHLIPTQTSSGPEIRSPISFRRPTRPPVDILYPSYVFYGISCVRGAQNSTSGRFRANFRPRGRIFVVIFNEELSFFAISTSNFCLRGRIFGAISW